MTLRSSTMHYKWLKTSGHTTFKKEGYIIAHKKSIRTQKVVFGFEII